MSVCLSVHPSVHLSVSSVHLSFLTVRLSFCMSFNLSPSLFLSLHLSLPLSQSLSITVFSAYLLKKKYASAFTINMNLLLFLLLLLLLNINTIKGISKTPLLLLHTEIVVLIVLKYMFLDGNMYKTLPSHCLSTFW